METASLFRLCTAFAVCFCALTTPSRASPPQGSTQSLEILLKEGLDSNSEIQGMRANAKAQESRVSSEGFLDNPRLGLVQENNLNLMEQQSGPMGLWSISQEIKFPTKYFILGEIQKYKSKGASQDVLTKELDVRQKIISGYYQLFATDRTLSLLQAQRETIREIARAAEAKHSAGTVPQQDEMKAHVELTRIENEILKAQEDKTAVESALNSLLNREAADIVLLPKEDLPVPKLILNDNEIQERAHSGKNHIKHGAYLVQEAEARKRLAHFSYAPDFSITFKKAFSNTPQNNYAIGFEFTIPLWFFEKQTSDVAAAGYELTQAQKNYETILRKTHSEVRSLLARARNHQNILKIYETSLIPQSTSTLNSSRGSYRAGRTGFQDLLDSERSLYSIRIGYYQTLAEYVDSLSKLEQSAGASVSTLPFGVDDE